MAKRNKYSKYNKEQSVWSWLPLLLIFAILPAISYLHLYDANLSDYSWYSDGGTATDLFLWGKAMFFIILNVVMVLQLAYSAFMKGKLVKARIYIPLLVYVALAFLSSVVSKYRDYAMSGSFEQFESVWVLLGYGITAYYVFAMLQSEQDVKRLMVTLAAGAAISCLIGLSQAMGHNFWGTELGKILRIPDKELRDAVSISTVFGDTRVYMSLYNPNYVGMYAALLVPIFGILAIPYKTPAVSGKMAKNAPVQKNNWKKVLVCVGLLLLCAALLGCTLGSQSKNGFLSLAAAFVLLLVLFAIRYRKYWYASVLAVVLLIGALFGFDHLMGNQITNALKNSFLSTAKEYVLQDISFEGDHVVMTLSGEPLSIYLEESGKFEFKDAAGGVLGLEADGEKYRIADERFKMLQIEMVMEGTQVYLGVKYAGNTWYFRCQSGVMECLSPAGKWCTFQAPATALFDGRESFFSSRGYIWARTIPLLKDYILLGSGADSFVQVFPNDDYVGKFNSGYYTTLITKPHSMYMQIWVQTGMLSMIAFVVFYLWYFICSCRIYLRCRLDNFTARAGLGILIGTFGYMVSGLTNDSSVTVAPLFWGLMGLGIGINLKLMKDELPKKEEETEVPAKEKAIKKKR